MRYLHFVLGEKEDKLNKIVADTVKFILFMDKLFDSVNNIYTTILPGKELRRAVTSLFPH